MCGKIYLEIAKSCLENWYTDMPEKEKSALLSRADFNELESYINAKSSIEAAIRGFNYGCRAVKLPNYYFLPEQFIQDLIMNDNFTEDWQKHFDKIRSNALCKDPYKLAEAAVLALDSIHNEWVKNNTKKFFDEKRSDKRFMFMPLPFIGWAEAKKDLIFLMPIIKALEFKISEDSVKDMYEHMRKKFSFNELVYCIKKLGYIYTPLDESIAESFKKDDTAKIIATQCLAAI